MAPDEPLQLLQQQQQTLKQLRLFSLRDPLTDRFGADFFRALPQVPGVYFFYCAQGTLLYIGQSLDLRARIGSYRHVTPEKNPKRTLRLVYRIARIEWQTCATAAAAIELESTLLLEHRPPFNRAGVWLGDPWWLTVSAQAEKLHLKLTRNQPAAPTAAEPANAAPIGPLPSAFRYAFGSLIRCLYRTAHPTLPIAAYPHRLFDFQIPLTITLSLPDPTATAQLITAYTQEHTTDFLTPFAALPPATSLLEQEYWLEEIETLTRYAAKSRRVNLSQNDLTKKTVLLSPNDTPLQNPLFADEHQILLGP
jgi:hypothetical protein